MAHDDDAEREVRRRMAAHELYTDAVPGLERLEEERLREVLRSFTPPAAPLVPPPPALRDRDRTLGAIRELLAHRD